MKNSLQKRAVKKWKSFLHSPFSMASFSVNDSQLPAGTVISTEAKRSGEISLRNVASPWWQEISRLCVSLEPKIFAPYRRVPPLEMTMPAGS